MPSMNTCAILVAAGKSTRMGKDKQRIIIGQKTVIERCLDNFQASSHIDSIVVVTRKELIPFIKSIAPTKVYAIVEGGNSRQESVCRGIAALPKTTQYIAVHDGARPFVSPALIDSICEQAYEFGAAVPVIPITSTVKQIDPNGIVISTIDRNCLRLVQTPQVFQLTKYQQALAYAAGMDFTDDCQLFEKMGLPVAWIDGDEKNIKITTPDDLLLAQLIEKRMNEA